MFETIIQGQASERAGRKTTVLVSFAIHLLIISILIVIPLIYYQTIPGGWEKLSNLILTPPNVLPPGPPPAPQPASGPRIPTNRLVVVRVPGLVEPSPVPPPPNAPEIDLADLATVNTGPSGPPSVFVPNSGFGPQIPNVIMPTRTNTAPPPPPPKPPKQPMLISSLDPSRVIFRVEPVYPPLAITSRVQGPVMLQVTVNELGIVESVEVVSGHALLVRAAVEAVKQWRYKPTILNGEPVPVKATVTVNFNLRR